MRITGLRSVLVFAFLFYGCVVSLGCAQKLTPQQEHGYKAVETCTAEAGNQGWTYWVLPNGSIRFEGRADGFGPVQQCLTQKFGYRF